MDTLTNCSWYIHNHIRCVISSWFGHFASNLVRYIEKSEQKSPPFQKCWRRKLSTAHVWSVSTSGQENVCCREQFLRNKCTKNTTTMFISCQYIYLIHRNAFSIIYIYIIILMTWRHSKDTCTDVVKVP